MRNSKLFVAAVMLATVALAPGLAEARSHHRHYYGDHDYHYRLPYPISYSHNYGPADAPGTFAYYDGPSTNHCYQGSANYVGQDRRLHPCF
jgi:hypothetical protein